jgi:hypothetical protein
MTLHRSCLLVLPLLVLALLAPSAYADSLGPALSTYAVLGATAVTNASGTGNPTIVTGNLGSATAVTGFPPGVVNGSIDPISPSVAAAQGNLTSAFTTLAGLGAGGAVVTGGVLNSFDGGVYTPGAYVVPNAVSNLTGTISLNDGGVGNSVFIFYTGAANTLITSPNSVVNVSGLQSTDSVYWVVGSAATLGDSSVIEGNILALNQITFDPGAQDPCGRALSETAGVVFDGAAPATTVGTPNVVGIGCGGTTATAGGGFNGGGGTPVSTTPEPGTFLLLGTGIAGLAGMAQMRRARVRRA